MMQYIPLLILAVLTGIAAAVVYHDSKPAKPAAPVKPRRTVTVYHDGHIVKQYSGELEMLECTDSCVRFLDEVGDLHEVRFPGGIVIVDED